MEVIKGDINAQPEAKEKVDALIRQLDEGLEAAVGERRGFVLLLQDGGNGTNLIANMPEESVHNEVLMAAELVRAWQATAQAGEVQDEDQAFGVAVEELAPVIDERLLKLRGEKQPFLLLVGGIERIHSISNMTTEGQASMMVDMLSSIATPIELPGQEVANG
jgi:hypothetical protein